jgi:hypothetical protein
MMTAGATLTASDYLTISLACPVVHLNLYAVMNLFQESKTRGVRKKIERSGYEGKQTRYLDRR